MKAFAAALFIAGLVLATPARADDPAVANIVTAMQSSGTYTYSLRTDHENTTVRTLSGEDFGQVQDTEGAGIARGKDGKWEANPHIAHRIAPFVVQRAFRIREAPGLVMDIEGLGNRTERLYAAGEAEAVYAVMHLAPPDSFNKWLAKNASPGSDIVDLPANDALTKATVQTSDTNGFLAAAKRRYDHVRAQLVRKFNRSYLFYAPPAAMGWSLRKTPDGKTLYAVATISDLMYSAQFWLEYDGQLHNGAWVSHKVYGQEVFKGE